MRFSHSLYHPVRTGLNVDLQENDSLGRKKKRLSEKVKKRAIEKKSRREKFHYKQVISFLSASLSSLWLFIALLPHLLLSCVGLFIPLLSVNSSSNLCLFIEDTSREKDDSLVYTRESSLA